MLFRSLSTSSVTPPLAWTNDCLIEWGGAQRWFHTAADPAEIHALAALVGACATPFKSEAQTFAPLAPPVLALHQRIKAQFDPHGLFGRGRLHPEL